MVRIVQQRTPNGMAGRYSMALKLLEGHFDHVDPKLKQELSDGAKETGTKLFMANQFENAFTCYSLAFNNRKLSTRSDI
eukprot:gene14523-17150_t